MINLFNTLEKVETKDRTALGKLQAINQAFVLALSHKMHEETTQECIDGKIKSTTSKYDTHKTQTKHFLENEPSVFVINLAWAGDPSLMEILKLLVSLPDSFCTSELFQAQKTKKVTYTFKGMICY